MDSSSSRSYSESHFARFALGCIFSPQDFLLFPVNEFVLVFFSFSVKIGGNIYSAWARSRHHMNLRLRYFSTSIASIFLFMNIKPICYLSPSAADDQWFPNLRTENIWVKIKALHPRCLPLPLRSLYGERGIADISQRSPLSRGRPGDQ